jgi:thiol:disulfide interchange protein
MSFMEAKGAAGGSGRFLVVAGVNPWSSTCTMMDETTWSDPRVAAWIRSRALAVRVDIVGDRQRARELGIRIAPTIIVYSGNREIDRAVGYETPERFLAWLEAVRQRAASR